MSDNLFEVRNVSKIYGPEDTGLVALSNYSFTIPAEPARIITIAGESGSGKSTLGELLLRSSPPTRGEILFQGVDIWKFNEQQKRDYHRHVQAVFQDPFGVYNPFYRIEHVFDMVLSNYRLAPSKERGRELTEEARRTVEAERADAPVTVATIMPTGMPRYDASAKPALFMAPPASVRPASSAPSRLGDGRHVRLRSIANVASRQDISNRLDAFRSRARSRPARRVGALRR